MLACENEECSRRFCQHCLLVHIQEDMDPASSNSWTVIDGKVGQLLFAIKFVTFIAVTRGAPLDTGHGPSPIGSVLAVQK
jgi:hypothetical protein